jgi:hypothetical protein
MEPSLTDKFFTLNPQQQRSVHFALCEYALRRWDLYTKPQNKIEYRETVTGSRQEVDKQLPLDAFEAAMQGLDSLNISERYQEPIAALQDNDLVFPENISFAYYAIYNLFKKYGKKEIVDDWLIVNQALSAEDNSEAWELLLSEVIQKVIL